MSNGITNTEIEEVLDQLLATSEIVKSILPVQSVTTSDDTTAATTVNQTVYVLAAVSSTQNSEEEGSIFIFKSIFMKTHQDDADGIVNFELLATLPLTNNLNITMAQSRSRSSTIDMTPGKYTPAARQSFVLTLTYERRKWMFSTESSETLGNFVTECRRLIAVANSASKLSFGWLEKYHVRRRLQVPMLFPRPDLREKQKNGHSRLSPATAGHPGDEDSDILLIVGEWLRSKLQNDKNVFTETRNTRIRLGTFNVNGRTPSQDLSPWIRPQHTTPFAKPSLPPLKAISPISLSSFTASDYLSARDIVSDGDNDTHNTLICDSNEEPDIYVLGFQELDLSTEALLYGSNTIREDMWVDAIFAALGEMRNQYTKLISKQLVGMLIICIVKNELVKGITDVKTCSAGAGIMGVMGNKGAVALRITLYSTVISFVNAHLAAFEEYFERRNADFQDLSRRLLFVSSVENETSEDMLEQSSESIFHSDVLFWMRADLNYRIDLPDAEVRQLIGGKTTTRKYDIRDLLSRDQLTKARLERKAFEDFTEGEISDLPSYRFSTGIATDANGYDIKRRPAWTDRVLHRVAPYIRYRQTKYSVHPELTMSDHKPVSADFLVATCLADQEAYYNQVTKMARHLENVIDSEEPPKLNVLPNEVQFGDVWYKKKATQKLTLQNIGKIPCAFRFVSQEENEPTFPPWLSVTPQMGVILPSEELSVQLTVHVDEASGPAMNIGNVKLQCTLILRTIQGKDHFIVITGNYKRTCLANELATLVRLPGPIRQTDFIKEPPSDNTRTKVNAPREIMRLIEWLMTYATDIPDLFLQRGDAGMEESIRESLDTGVDFSVGQLGQSEDSRRTLALSFADVLFQFFQSLPSSVIPAALQERCAQVTDRDEAFEVISSELPGYVLNVWISLTAFLHFIAQRNAESDKPNENDKALALACIFAPVLLRDEPGKHPQMTPLAKRRFLLHFIQ